MTDYQKSMRVEARPEALFDALTTLPGLTAWWTRATGSGSAGGELRFFFGSPDPCVTHVDEAGPGSVAWTVTECRFLPDWVGTRPTFTIMPTGPDQSELRFRHYGLHATLECFDQCTRGWDHFLPSLRDYAGTGRGMPRDSPGDRARRAPQPGDHTVTGR